MSLNDDDFDHLFLGCSVHLENAISYLAPSSITVYKAVAGVLGRQWSSVAEWGTTMGPHREECYSVSRIIMQKHRSSGLRREETRQAKVFRNSFGGHRLNEHREAEVGPTAYRPHPRGSAANRAGADFAEEQQRPEQ